jgi:ABC-type multidrug transport system fused ATPase/permease subunit
MKRSMEVCVTEFKCESGTLEPCRSVYPIYRLHMHSSAAMQVRAAVRLHNAMLDRVLRLPVAFFDTNPSGRIINRFSRDTEIMDSVLPQSLAQARFHLIAFLALYSCVVASEHVAS